MSPANFIVASPARRARLVSGLANGIAREGRAPAERPKGMGGREYVRAAAGIVAHRPYEVKNRDMPAAVSIGVGMRPRAATSPTRSGRCFFGRMVLSYLN